MGSLEVFCGSKFWDYDYTWNTTNPDLTPCFQNTVLVWVPCGFLWLLAPIETYYLLKSPNKFIPWTALNISKLALTLLLVLVCLVEFFRAAFEVLSYGNPIPSVYFYAPFIKTVSFLLIIAFILAGRKRGIQSSGVLFIFWLLLLLCGAVTYRSHLTSALGKEYRKYEEDKFLFGTYMVYYPLVLAQFIISCFADARPAYRQHPIPAGDKECPEESSSFLSRLLFCWFNELSLIGFKRPLELKDLWSLNFGDRTENVIPKFDQFWKEELLKKRIDERSASYNHKGEDGEVKFSGKKKAKQPTILKPLFKTFGSAFLIGGSLKLVHDTLQFILPQLLKLMIAFVSSSDPSWKGVMYGILMFVVASLQSVILSAYFHLMYIIGMRIRTTLISAIYRKSLILSNSSKRESTTGEIVNLMSNDAQKFMELMVFLNMIWSAPFQITLALYFLWEILGPSVLAGVGVMILMIPINGVVAAISKKLQVQQMKNKDQRVKVMNEILSGMKVLKLYAWEESFEANVQSIRGTEVHRLKKIAYLSSVFSFLWTCAPFLVSLITFLTFVLVDEENVLNAEKAFVSLALFNILRFPLSMLPMLISMIVQVSVATKRLNKYLSSEELDPYVSKEKSEASALVVEQGTFAWGKEESPVLKDVNIDVPHGSLVSIVGQVGSGKSSLLSSVLGDMEKIDGRVNINGSVAYVAQQAWIQNASLRDNILFMRPYEEERYNKIIDACALRADLAILPGGDLTEIGEKGINLSGGQKQRVSLARAVYSNTDIYLLDDPLSAVDSHVGKHIFENVIGPNGALKDKTRILVTHGISFLPSTDAIVVMKDGTVLEKGSYKELLDKKGAFAEFLVQYLKEEVEEGTGLSNVEAELVEEIIMKVGTPEIERQISQRQLSEEMSENERINLIWSLSRQLSESRSMDSHQQSPLRQLSISSSASRHTLSEKKPPVDRLAEPNEKAKLVQIETAETGKVKWSVYWTYFNAVGMFWVVLIVLINAASQGFQVGSNLWLSAWSNDQPLPDGTQDIPMRNLRLGVYGALGFGQAFMVLFGSFTLALGTLKASKNLHNGLLSNILRSPMSFFDTTPQGRIVNRFSKDIDTVDTTIPMTIRSWLFCMLQVLATLFVISFETPQFLFIILPIGVIYYLIQIFYVATSRQLKRLESVSRSPIYTHFSETLTGVSTIRAYSAQEKFILESNLRVDTNNMCLYPTNVANRWLAIRLEFCGNLIVLFAALFAVFGRETMDGGTVGLTLSYALSITTTLNWMVRMSTELETNIVSVERIMEYTYTETEAPWIIEGNRTRKDWPEAGEVRFDRYSTRYREGLELVVKGITCYINPGEKVGIVGRTGAGKSSLTLSLFRIIEPAEGTIYIDNVDISNIGLHDLRSRLTIIPQDPILFSGTIRSNLDPFKSHDDKEVWIALEHSHLKTFVSSLEKGLEHEVAEGGENLSVGQRQLVCLARALLRKSRVLVLDEATAAVDLETDDLIQKTIREEFKECTILTIAHRLNTIMDYNRILVMEKGLIAEFDSPSKLLEKEDSIFYGMAKDAGLV